MKFRGGLLIGIGIGIALFVLLMTVNVWMINELIEQEKEKRVKYLEKIAQEKLECEDDRGVWQNCTPCIVPPGGIDCDMSCDGYCNMQDTELIPENKEILNP